MTHRPSRRASLAALLLLVPVAAACAGSDDAPGDDAPPSRALPAVTLESLDGGAPVDLSTLRGPLVINLWAAWCGPCRTELPIYARFARRYAGRVDVLGIDWNDPQRDAAIELARTSGVAYPLLADPDSEIDGEGPFPAIRGLPAMAFVDEQGEVTHFEYGEITSVAELVGLVDEHLGVAL